MVIYNISFDKPNKCYKPGDTVNCHLHIHVEEKFKACSLSVEFCGYGYTETPVSKSEYVNTRMLTLENYKGRENYFVSRQYLIGSEHSNAVDIESDTYHYDISFILPQVLPDSFEYREKVKFGWYGRIRYIVEVSYNVPLGFNKVFAETFFVLSDFDLNHTNNSCEPIQSVKGMFIGCCCFSETIQIILTLPKSGFLRGEPIPITVEIDNETNVRINFLKLQLLERLTLIATKPRIVQKIETKVLDETTIKANVAQYQNEIFKSYIQLNPNYDYRIFEGSVLFNCDYIVRVEGLALRCSKCPYNEVKIKIGTVSSFD